MVRDKINKLKEYYKKNCETLVFSGKQSQVDPNLTLYANCFDIDMEYDNFIKVFTEYIPYYIPNYDRIKFYEFDNDFENKLLKYAKNIWKNNSSVTRESNIAQSGLFGELFNEFYLSIVKNDEIAVSFANRKGFKDRRSPKGVDIIGISIIDDDKIEFIFSEAKFVNSRSSSTNSLCKDILGGTNVEDEPPHLCPNYINDYGYFVMGHINDKINSDLIKEKLDIVNKKSIVEEKKFIDIINELDYSIKFVYFSIFQSTKNLISDMNNSFNDIIDNFNSKIGETNINNYSIDIVFVRTKNTSMNLKEGMIENVSG